MNKVKIDLFRPFFLSALSVQSLRHMHTLTTIWSNPNLHPEKPFPWWLTNLKPHPEGLSFACFFSFIASLHLICLCHIKHETASVSLLPIRLSALSLAPFSCQSYRWGWLWFEVVATLASGSEVRFQRNTGFRFWGLFGFSLSDHQHHLSTDFKTEGEYPKHTYNLSHTHTHTAMCM